MTSSFASRTHLAALVLLGALLVAAPAANAPAEDNARGQELFALCSQCHGSAGTGNSLFLAPSIAGLPDWYVNEQLTKFRAGIRGAHPGDTGGLRMYPMSLWLASDEDVHAVAAYVASLPRPELTPELEGGVAEHGKQAYTTICTTCHGPQGAGNEAMKAPPLARASDWYLLSSLKKFKSGVRGGDPRDINGAAMRGMAGTLPDEQAMKDVVAYIGTLGE